MSSAGTSEARLAEALCSSEFRERFAKIARGGEVFEYHFVASAFGRRIDNDIGSELRLRRIPPLRKIFLTQINHRHKGTLAGPT
jgi:hypothetical protein